MIDNNKKLLFESRRCLGNHNVECMVKNFFEISPFPPADKCDKWFYIYFHDVKNCFVCTGFGGALHGGFRWLRP